MKPEQMNKIDNRIIIIAKSISKLIINTIYTCVLFVLFVLVVISLIIVNNVPIV